MVPESGKAQQYEASKEGSNFTTHTTFYGVGHSTAPKGKLSPLRIAGVPPSCHLATAATAAAAAIAAVEGRDDESGSALEHAVPAAQEEDAAPAVECKRDALARLALFLKNKRTAATTTTGTLSVSAGSLSQGPSAARPSSQIEIPDEIPLPLTPRSFFKKQWGGESCDESDDDDAVQKAVASKDKELKALEGKLAAKEHAIAKLKLDVSSSLSLLQTTSLKQSSLAQKAIRQAHSRAEAATREAHLLRDQLRQRRGGQGGGEKKQGGERSNPNEAEIVDVVSRKVETSSNKSSGNGGGGSVAAGPNLFESVSDEGLEIQRKVAGDEGREDKAEEKQNEREWKKGGGKEMHLPQAEDKDGYEEMLGSRSSSRYRKFRTVGPSSAKSVYSSQFAQSKSLPSISECISVKSGNRKAGEGVFASTELAYGLLGFELNKSETGAAREQLTKGKDGKGEGGGGGGGGGGEKEEEEEEEEDVSINERFQRCLEDGNDLGLYHLSENFTEMAKLYSKVIVSEMNLSRREKAIKPWDAVGGTAGGIKYRHRGIVFKVIEGDQCIGHDRSGRPLYFHTAVAGVDGDTKRLAADIRNMEEIEEHTWEGVEIGSGDGVDMDGSTTSRRSRRWSRRRRRRWSRRRRRSYFSAGAKTFSFDKSGLAIYTLAVAAAATAGAALL